MALKRRKITFYRKEACHLCEEMELHLADFIARNSDKLSIEVDVRDIEDEDHWFRTYREYVPVLVVDQEEVCHYFMDEEELEAALTK